MSSYDPKEVITGTFDDWAYEQKGLFAWTVEVWSPAPGWNYRVQIHRLVSGNTLGKMT